MGLGLIASASSPTWPQPAEKKPPKPCTNLRSAIGLTAAPAAFIPSSPAPSRLSPPTSADTATHYVAETTNTYRRFESFAPPSQRVIAIATIRYQHGPDTSVAHAQLKEHVS